MLDLAKTSKLFLIEKGDLVLIDKGQTGDNTRNVINFLRDLVKENEAIDLCILTHRHRDHMGGLRCLKDVYGFEVVSHSSEADAVERSTGVGVDLRLEDGDVIPRYGGLRVIHVPGSQAKAYSLVTPCSAAGRPQATALPLQLGP